MLIRRKVKQSYLSWV